MPHKHRRDKCRNDASFWDLPPSKSAQSLPVKRAAATNSTQSPTKHPKRKHANIHQDTPRAFTRLLTAYRPPRSGLDDGIQPSKKHKTSKATAEHDSTVPIPTMLPPTVQPHEPLSAFNARVDAALPFSGVSKRSGGGKEVGKERQTKTEKKMQKMQAEWREEERRRKEKLGEEEDEVAVDENGIDDMLRAVKKTKPKGGKGRKSGGDETVEDDDDDPWAHITAKRIEERDGATAAGLVGLHDVVQAPPKFSKVRKGKEDLRTGPGPGGLRRQVELSEARKSVIDGYREKMKAKRIEDE